MMQERPHVPTSQRIFGEIVYWITVLCAILCIVGPLIIFVDMDNNVLNPHTLFGNIFEGRPTTSGVEIEKEVAGEDTVLHLKEVDIFKDMFDKLGEESSVALHASASAGDTVLELVEMQEYEVGDTIFFESEIYKETAKIASMDTAKNTITLEQGLLYDYSTEGVVEVALVDEPIVVINDSETLATKRVLRAIDEEASTITVDAAVGRTYSLKDHPEAGEESIWDKAKDGVEGGHYWMQYFTTGDGFTLFGMFLGCAVGIIAMVLTGLFLMVKEKSIGWGLGAFFIAFMSFISMIGLVQTH